MLKERGTLYANFANKETQAQSTSPLINYQEPASKRGVDMLLAKFYGKAYQSEVPMPSCREVQVPILKIALSAASILLVTDGGLVPKSNPDKLPSSNASAYYIYPIQELASLDPLCYEVSHQGYDNSDVSKNPNRLVPVDALRLLEKEHVIGKLYDAFISTAGVMTSVENSIQFGKEIAAYLLAHSVDAVILSSTCGTSTRCGAYIAKSIEAVGIPVVQVTNLVQISDDIGVSRIVKGDNICHVFGHSATSPKAELDYRLSLVKKALHLLTATPEQNTNLIAW